MHLLQGQHNPITQVVGVIYANHRVDVRMTDELALNVGYRYVGITEDFALPLPNLGYSPSLSWFFFPPMSFSSSP